MSIPRSVSSIVFCFSASTTPGWKEDVLYTNMCELDAELVKVGVGGIDYEDRGGGDGDIVFDVTFYPHNRDQSGVSIELIESRIIQAATKSGVTISRD